MKYLPCCAALAACCLGGAAQAGGANDANTTTPIRHVIVVVGENVTFDTLFATYVPPRGRSVANLLSKGIVNADGSPGPNYAQAVQGTGVNLGEAYMVEPVRIGAMSELPQPFLTGSYDLATGVENADLPDPRFANLKANGPFQISGTVPYMSLTSEHAPATTGDPVHRFFQMWQQTGGTNAKLDMYTWVASTAGQGADTIGVTPQVPGQGGELMGFWNMATGDAPYFKSLAQTYAMSDNAHQAIMGGTGANFFMLATGDVAVYRNGTSTTPPANQIENPNPMAGTANFYVNDGYEGGSYVNCADPGQPGVAAILSVLTAQGRASNCAFGTYYLVNNYNPGYDINGNLVKLGPTYFNYPPQTVPTIAERLAAGGVSWKWYTGARDTADVTGDPEWAEIAHLVSASVAAQLPPGTPQSVIQAVVFRAVQGLLYNNIGDPLNGSANIQANPALKAGLAGLTTFYNDVAAGTLPAVSFVVPKNLESGHPGYSVPGLYEAFVKDLLARVQGNAALWADTAVIITTDEGGGYFDSGVIQPLDFFGDGTRIPLIVASPYVTPGYIDHTYLDHVSILKFIEHNWKLGTISGRSRDNLANPVRNPNNPYLPANQPAIGDLTTLFTFPATSITK